MCFIELPHTVTMLIIDGNHISFFHLYGVLHRTSKVVSATDNGFIAEDKVTIQIPLSVRSDTTNGYKSPVVWKKQLQSEKDESFTFFDGVIVIKGDIDVSTISDVSLTALKKQFDEVSVINSIDTCDWGSEMLQHWKVVCK